jgi:hypothetical protein
MLMVAEIADLDLPVSPPDGVRVLTVEDDDGVGTMLRVHDEVFGRGSGVFRALVGPRALVARARGYRYAQVEALPTSRPILERMGFPPLAETTPWVRDG